ncbi:hypothetical protein HDU96_002901 [Phlyctochytrium bullatum]|nr:hypothetical protein HDU96_002901 [Phlyctochytrium bullatum]
MKFTALVTLSLVAAACAQTCNEVCPAIAKPVCGTNNVDYENECQLQVAACKNPAANITVAFTGACKDASSDICNALKNGAVVDCPNIVAPVCGSDGKSYNTLCELEITACSTPGLKKVRDGKCDGSSEICNALKNGAAVDCPAVVAPVCGSDGKNYNTLCELQIAACTTPNLTKVRDGKCDGSSEICTAIKNGAVVDCPPPAPVCGSNGQSYNSLCELEIAACSIPNLTKVRDGRCEATCSEICPDIAKPVCGTDKVDYENECRLQVAACKNPDAKITKWFDGKCDTCAFPCTMEGAPVCGSNQVTYGNKCELRVAACKNPTANITVASTGACKNGNGGGYSTLPATTSMVTPPAATSKPTNLYQNGAAGLAASVVGAVVGGAAAIAML